MNILQEVFVMYFYVFLTLLPITLIISTIYFIIKNRKEKFLVKNYVFMYLVLIVSVLMLVVIALFIYYTKTIMLKLGTIKTYIIYLAIIFSTYLTVTFIEDLALEPKKYMLSMTSNLEISIFKHTVIIDVLSKALKMYIYIAYIVAIFFFQLEGLGKTVFDNVFIKNIMSICNNSITIIFAIELLITYRKQKKKETKNLKEGNKLFENFLSISNEYLKMYQDFYNEFETVLYKNDNEFFNKVKNLKTSLEERLNDITNFQDYEEVKESKKIKTYLVFYNAVVESLTNSLNNKSIKTNDKKFVIANMLLYFRKIIVNEINIKSKEKLIKKLNQFINLQQRKHYKDI